MPEEPIPILTARDGLLSLPPSKKHSFWQALASIFILGLVLRLIALGGKSFWDDESQTLYLSTIPLSRAWWEIYTTDHAGHVFMFFSRFLGVTQDSPEALFRLPYAFAGSLCIPLCFLLLRRLVAEGPALVGTLLMACSPLYLQVSQDARFYALLLLFFLLSTVAVLEYARAAQKTRPILLLYIVAVALGLNTDWAPFMGYLPFHAVLLFLIARSWPKLRVLLICQGLALLGLAPYLVGLHRLHLPPSALGLASGHTYPIFASPTEQMMMYGTTFMRSLQALTGPPWRYLKVLEFSLGVEKKMLPMLLFLAGSILAAAYFRFGSRGIVTPKGKPVGRWFLLAGLGLFAGSFKMLLGGAPFKPQLLFLFLLPLALSSLLILLPFFSGEARSLRQGLLYLFFFVPFLCGIKLLIPLDPRHFAIALVFVLPLYAQGIWTGWQKARSRVLVAALGACLVTSQCFYYLSPTQIYKDFNYRAMVRDLGRQLSPTDKVLVSHGGQGNRLFDYYCKKNGLEARQGAFWYGQYDADQDIPVIKEALNREFASTTGPVGSRRRVFLLSVNRLESPFFQLMRDLAAGYEIQPHFYGDELLMIEIAGKKTPAGS